MRLLKVDSDASFSGRCAGSRLFPKLRDKTAQFVVGNVAITARSDVRPALVGCFLQGVEAGGHEEFAFFDEAQAFSQDFVDIPVTARANQSLDEVVLLIIKDDMASCHGSGSGGLGVSKL